VSHPPATCALPGCGRSLAGRRGNTRYCCQKHRGDAFKLRQVAGEGAGEALETFPRSGPLSDGTPRAAKRSEVAAEAARKSLWHFKRLLSYGTAEEVGAFFAELRQALTPDRRARIEAEIAAVFGERKRQAEVHEQAMTMRPRRDDPGRWTR
jgi:hypothetical protein